ncbi:MAG: heme-binding protein [Gammaproteobacteria bacterium]
MLTLDQAVQIASSGLQEGKQRGFAPLCIAVLDTGAHVLALLRDERAAIGRPDIAITKASGCLSMGFGGRELARRAQHSPQFFFSLASIFPRGILPVPGGVLIRDAGGAIVGAVGVSGDTSDNDEICALAGIAAAALIADAGTAAVT